MEQKDTSVKRLEIVNNSKEPWYKVASSIIASLCTIVAAIVGCCCATSISQSIQNSNTQKQTQVVIEPREGDIIVKDGDDYKLLQLISESDIAFPSKIQEVQYTTLNSQSERVDINNINGEDWSKRDSFVYVINSFSINPNKVINLLENIESINVYCDFYIDKDISTFVELGDKAFAFNMRESIDELDFEVTKANIESQYEYVTSEGLNDGIEWVKIRVEIVYIIGERKIKDTITSDWIAIAEDPFG